MILRTGEVDVGHRASVQELRNIALVNPIQAERVVSNRDGFVRKEKA
jgi:hypothetical protein